MDKTHNSYFFNHFSRSQIYFISSHEIKEQKHTSSKLPQIHLFDHVVHRFDFI